MEPGKYLPALKKVSFQGVTGPVAFDERGDTQHGAVTRYQFRNGKMVPAPATRSPRQSLGDLRLEFDEINMDILLQQIINGLVVGSLYALIALGYTMVYGILGLINFAHGEVLMIGALVHSRPSCFCNRPGQG